MQAFLITAYKDEEQLLRLVRSLNGWAKVFVHIDVKSAELNLARMEEMHLPNTTWISRYRVGWGAFAHVQAILDLMELALADPEIHYLHTLSAQDLPARPIRELERRFAEGCQEIYMTCFDDTEFLPVVKERYQYRVPNADWDMNNLFLRKLSGLSLRLQKMFHRQHVGIGGQTRIYKGMIWLSAPRSAFTYVQEYLKQDPAFYEALKHIRIPEEFLFQTILMNSEYRENVIKRNLRYTDWESGTGASPAVIGPEHYERILAKDVCFARKIDSEQSGALIGMLQDLLLQ